MPQGYTDNRTMGKVSRAPPRRELDNRRSAMCSTGPLDRAIFANHEPSR
jgi:hypothetical protein